MREIKFRAWHKEKRILVRGIDFYLSNGTVHLPIETDITDEYWWDSTTWDLKDVELMQYTGLKDKNGTEIYEGDIVQVEEKVMVLRKMTNVKVNKVVKYKKDYAQFLLYTNKRTEHLTFATFGEVIGNIYEHKHLLEREK